MSRPPPSREQLIALLIEERAKVIHARARCGMPWSQCNEPPTTEHHDQARREIEAEVLNKPTRATP